MQTFINNAVEQQKISKGEWLHKLPQELIGILPQNVWTSLSLEQKKDILRQHNLLDKYNNEGESPAVASEVVNPSVEGVAVTNSSEVSASPVVEAKESEVPQVLEVDKGMTPEKEAFAKNVEAIKAKEEQMKNEPVLSGEDKARIAQEQAVSSSKKDDVKPSVGYKIQSDTASNAVSISQSGNTDDGRTWAAALVRKIFAIFD